MNIHNLKKDLGIKACECFLFGHAILGCDTTSSVFGVGKGTALKLITTDTNFQKYAAESTKMEIEEAVQAALMTIYNNGKYHNIDKLRYKRFCRKVATSSLFVHPKVLPPTASASKYHSFRVYLQVQN